MKVRVCFVIIGIVSLLNFNFYASSTILEDFEDITEWDLRGVEVETDSGNSRVSVDGEGSISKEFCYNLDSEPYTSINIPEIDSGVSWNIDILTGGQTYTLQKLSRNYNKFDESNDQFMYPLYML